MATIRWHQNKDTLGQAKSDALDVFDYQTSQF